MKENSLCFALNKDGLTVYEYLCKTMLFSQFKYKIIIAGKG
jgi:hypothetical protein